MKKILSKVWMWIEGLWNDLDRLIDKLVPIAVNVTQVIKKAVESEKTTAVLEIIKFTIPGDTDDKIINKAVELAKKYIPKVALQLEIIDSISGIEDINEQMQAVVEALKNSNDDTKSDYWHEFTAQFLKAMADGKLTLGEAGSLAEYHFRNYVQLKK